MRVAAGVYPIAELVCFNARFRSAAAAGMPVAGAVESPVVREIMAESRRLRVFVSIPASLAGMRRIALLGAGRRGDRVLILMTAVGRDTDFRVRNHVLPLFVAEFHAASAALPVLDIKSKPFVFFLPYPVASVTITSDSNEYPREKYFLIGPQSGFLTH